MVNGTELQYRGDVTVELKIGDRCYTIANHNIGTKALKTFFARSLVGEYHETDLPAYISIEKWHYEEGTWIDYTDDIPVSAKALVDNGMAASFTAKINYSSLAGPVDPDDLDARYQFVLKSAGDYTGKELHKELATMGTTTEVLRYITPGVSAIVTWTLRIINEGENHG